MLTYLKYLLKRLGSSILTFLIVSVFIFILMELAPGDPAQMILGVNYTQQQYTDKVAELGLDQPGVVRYLEWLGSYVKGDMGTSYYNNENVTQSVISHLLPTLYLATASMIVIMLIAIPLGIFSAKHKNSPIDGTIVSLSLLGISIPTFLLSIVLIFFFGVTLNILPTSGYFPLEDGVGKSLRYMVLPVLSLSILNIAYITRMTRSAMLDVLGTDYIKTAKAKGLKGTLIFYKHALKNSFNTILTVLGQTYGGLIAGAAVVEMIFNIPGIGQLLISVVGKRDYPTILGIVMTICLIFIIINLVVDLLYGVFDPRVKITSKAK